ncbi:hypothetical protein LXA43DRAFT_70991 [Ganoderma leucocontextum]|nr:hypothetical protein LXA43DRAFT_475295 [Ganoderma leucocontextum]KAI1795238.1 hypothetical protein LXA43DRAFT_70991 [Ganoderma leucocontextum]
MGIRATLENLLVHLSPSLSQANRQNAGRDDGDSFSREGFGERKSVGASSPTIRTRTRKSSKFILSAPFSRFHSASLPTPTTAASLLDVAAEKLEAQYDINHIYHYLSSVESDLLQQTRITTDRSVQRWLRHANSYLPELMRLEGRGDFTSDVCCGCHDVLNKGYGLRCDDCHDRALYCITCCLAIHERHPLHRVWRWTLGSRFEPVELSQVGLRFQLGHAVGEKCSNPDVALSGSIVILDLSGFHEVGITFCSCKDAVPPYVQLLRQRWFPAACLGPRTAATFRLLEHFHDLSSQSNISALGYYRSLLRITNNTGVDPPTNQLAAFLVMIREWQLLKTLKRAGTGNVPGGIAATPPDGCTVQCPACLPRSIDLPDTSGDECQKKSWLHRLSPIAYFNKGHASGPRLASSRYESTPLKNTGRTTIACHHGMMRPSSDADKVWGNRDALESPWTSSVLLPAGSHNSPDDHLRDAPPLHQAVLSDDVRRQQAQSSHIHDFLRQTAIDGVARRTASTWTGLYGGLQDHTLGSWNWDKVTTLPMTLLLDAERAVSQRRIYDNVYNALNDLVPREHVELWVQMVLRWEMEGGEGEEGPNPFEFQHSLLGQKKVRVDLYREDLMAIQSGQAKFVGGEEDTASTIIAMGLDLEDEQLQLCAAVADLEPQSSGLREVGIVEEQGRLRRRIEAWHDTAQILIPVIASLRAQYADVAATLSAQDVPVYLPSSICSADLPDDRLLTHEWRLREAQAYDALAHLRAHLEVIAFLRSSAYKNPGVEEKANLVADVVRAKISMDVRRYRAAHTALVALAPVLGKTMEEGYLQELNDSDVRYISTFNGVSTPWIWRFGRTGLLDPAHLLDLDTNKDLNAALRVEWCDARAHARTGMQMCKSLHDEMRRAIASHEQRAYWWEMQIGRNFADHPDYCEGANSYAYRQASIRHSMKDHCGNLWASIRDCLSTGPYDLDDFPGASSLASGRVGGKDE